MRTSLKKTIVISALALTLTAPALLSAQDQVQRQQTRTQTRTMENCGECPDEKVERQEMTQRQQRKGSNGDKTQTMMQQCKSGR